MTHTNLTQEVLDSLETHLNASHEALGAYMNLPESSLAAAYAKRIHTTFGRGIVDALHDGFGFFEEGADPSKLFDVYGMAPLLTREKEAVLYGSIRRDAHPLLGRYLVFQALGEGILSGLPYFQNVRSSDDPEECASNKDMALENIEGLFNGIEKRSSDYWEFSLLPATACLQGASAGGQTKSIVLGELLRVLHVVRAAYEKPRL